MKKKYTDIYERGNDYDQAEFFANAPCGAYVTIEMLNAIISKLLIMIAKKQEKLDLGYVEYEDPSTGESQKYLHDVNGKDIFAEVSEKAIKDEYGNDIEQTYLKKQNLTFQYNQDDEIVGINNSAIAAGEGSKKLIGENGIYVYNDLTAHYIGVSADYAYNSALSSYQEKLTPEQLIDIDSIPFKLDKSEFADLSANVLATKEYVQDEIAEIGTPLVIRGSKTCEEIEELDNPKVGDVYCMEDSGTIHQPDYEDLEVLEKDEVAFTSDKGWIVIGREVAVDLKDYYKKTETSGAEQISTALDTIDQKFSDYYPQSATSGKDEISEALASKLDTSALNDYYKKTETSSTDELNTALANKANVSSLTSYVKTEVLATNYYDKTETSSKEQISAALDDKVDNSELDWYYTKAETSGSDQLDSAFGLKLDTSAFSTVSSDFVQTSSMTGYQSAGDYMSANALDDLSGNWNEVSSKQDKLTYGWDGDGKIISIDGSAIAGQGGATFTGDVQGALDEVYTNSAVWLTAHQDLSDYVTNETLTSNYYTIDEIDGALEEKADYSYIQDNYYNVTETSGADEISTALDEKLDVTAFEEKSSVWDDVKDTVETNSGAWSQGNNAVNELVESNSGTWNGVSSKLDTTAFSTVSGDFLTAHQDLSYISGVIDEKLDSTAYTPELFYPMNNPSGFITGVDLSNYYTKSETYNKDEVYDKNEVDSLLDGKIEVMTELPSSGDSGVIYYIGPVPGISGEDKYDEYIWNTTGTNWIKVGEHSLDLSGYVTENQLAEVYEYVDTSLEDKVGYGDIEGINNVITGINGSAIKDTVYSAGPNIDITNFVVSGRDWSDDIESAVSSKADVSDLEDLAEEMVENFSELDQKKQDISSMSGYVATSSTIVNIGSNNVIEAQSPGLFLQGIGNSGSVFSIAQGQNNSATTHSFAQGLQSSAVGTSMSQGTMCYGDSNSFSQGVQNSASIQSIAQGAANTASIGAFTQGQSNSATRQSIAQGAGNKSNTNSFAQGAGNSAINQSFAQGNDNTANNYSFAQGNKNYAINYSQAFGNGNIISESGMAIGTYNKTSADVSFVIGNGTSTGNRSDLFVIKQDGTVSSTGDFIYDDKSFSSLYDTVFTNSGDWVTESVFDNTINAISDEIDDIQDSLVTKQDLLTNEQLSAISSVSSLPHYILSGDSNITATSAQVGNDIRWDLRVNATPIVTDTTITGGTGITAATTDVPGEWEVGLTQEYSSVIEDVSAIPVITKSDIDEIWAVVTGERAHA